MTLDEQASLVNQYLSQGLTLAQAYEQAGANPSEFIESPAGLVIPKAPASFADNANLPPGTSGTGVLDVAQEENARRQASIAQNILQSATQGDWRVKLRLGPLANYLYKDPYIQRNDLLWPIRQTDGLIFPYTPQISTTYGANYNSYDLTHSNFRGYFYQNSYIDEITISATFTAQDTAEANYMLAAIHFFKSASKMFYGQDALRGVPPPLLYIKGFGDFQFNDHPCLMRSFNYNLPDNVDYIRARAQNINNNSRIADTNRYLSGTSIVGNNTASRLAQSGLGFGASEPTQSMSTRNSFFLTDESPTYVPTEIKIDISLLPIQTREQISNEFSLTEYARGSLLKRGFW